jgi:SAM-dependent methyltransferase
MEDKTTYFKYLKNRSRIGLTYRNFWLYPRLDKYLKGRVLDVGCGIGDFLAYKKDTVGVDINEYSLEWCRLQGHQVEKMDADYLPFDDESYDSIIMDNVLEHIESPEVIIGEIHRVLDKNGIFLVGVPGLFGYTKDSDHKIFYSKETLEKTLKKHGFFQLKIFAMPLNIDWLEKYLSQYCLYGVFTKVENNEL